MSRVRSSPAFGRVCGPLAAFAPCAVATACPLIGAKGFRGRMGRGWVEASSKRSRRVRLPRSGRSRSRAIRSPAGSAAGPGSACPRSAPVSAWRASRAPGARETAAARDRTIPWDHRSSARAGTPRPGSATIRRARGCAVAVYGTGGGVLAQRPVIPRPVRLASQTTNERREPGPHAGAARESERGPRHPSRQPSPHEAESHERGGRGARANSTPNF